MERRDNVSESEGSFADNQYDMIDDLSEISNDDHDTASIASNGDDGALTPEEEESGDEAEESTLHLGDERAATPPSTGLSFVDLRSQMPERPSNTSQTPQMVQVQAENDLIDSYTSEDLETPRQSAMPTTFSSTYHRSKGKAADWYSSSLPSNETSNHILFVSERNVNRTDVDLICARVASCMDPADASDDFEHRVVRLPSTPSGISLPSTTVVCGRGSVSATVQHCVGAETRSPGLYKLRILDFDGDHSSYFTIGKDAKIDLLKPRIAIFYLGETVGRNMWFEQAFRAVQILKVPMLIVRDPMLNKANDPTSHDLLLHGSQLSFYYNQIIDLDRQELTKSISELLGAQPTSIKKQCGRPGEYFGSKVKSVSRLRASWPKILFGLLSVVLPSLLLAVVGPAADPAVELAARREGLVAALTFTNLTDVSRDLNVTHLLPVATCGSNGHLLRQWKSSKCTPEVPYQGLSPNHILVSLPVKPRSPQLHGSATQVFGSDGRWLSSNQTKLIEGVYDITIPTDEAYGIVYVNILTNDPNLKAMATHDFGDRMLHRSTYDKVTSDVTKVIGKDVAVMRHAANGLSTKLSSELGAGLWATKNVTSELALYAARELQIFGNTAAAMLGKAAQASNQTATGLSKELVLIQKDLVRYTKDLSTTVKSTIDKFKSNSKAEFDSRIALSRQRAERFRKVFQRKKAAIASSARKEISSLDKLFSNVRRISGQKGCMKHDSTSTKALSVVPEHQTRCTGKSSQPSTAQPRAFTKQEYKQAMQQLNTLTKRITKLQNQAGDEKASRAQLRKMRREAKEYERLLANMRQDIEARGSTLPV